jgi:membrane-bound lytic murein transglycosylase D
MMGLIKNTKSLWLPFLAMLVSASFTSGFIELLNTLISHRQIQAVESLSKYGAYTRHAFLNAIAAPVNVSTFGEPGVDPVAVPDIWERMRTGFAFPEVHQDNVRTYLDEYIKHPYLIKQVLQRGEPYLFHILNRLEHEGMPAELALLPVVESAFDPFATSPVGAAGIWQFMPGTAAYVGLDQDWWYDGRRDIIASTDAALGYLRQLNRRFDGDWHLTLAAYNAGSARVKSAIRRNREAGKPVDFWHLSLPEETRSYVPKLIALRMIIEKPDDYHIQLPALLDTRHFTALKIQGQIELRVAAQLAGVPLVELQRLNPGYERSITPPDKSNTLLVPMPVEDIFRERIALLPQDQRVQSIRHRIRRGDSLSAIAQQYRTTVPLLRKANRLKGNKIIAGDLLIVPVARQENAMGENTYASLI